MRSFQRLGAAFVLACALTLPAFAGGMDTGMGVTSPPAMPPATTQAGMHTGPGVAETAGDSFTEAVLSLLAGVLSLF